MPRQISSISLSKETFPNLCLLSHNYSFSSAFFAEEVFVDVHWEMAVPVPQAAAVLVGSVDKFQVPTCETAAEAAGQQHWDWLEVFY